MTEKSDPPPPPSRAREAFLATPPEIQQVLKAILRDERDVANMQRRSDIYNRIYEHIRREIK